MNIFSSILTDKFLGAIFSTIFIIMLGYFLRKRNIVSDTTGKNLSNILLSAALPALAFNAFMTDINDQTFSIGMNVLVFGFVAYVLLILISKLIYTYLLRYKGNLNTTMVVLTAFGSTTFFGIPIINGILGSQGTLYANIFNIAYRVFLYSYGLIAMSGLKFEKKNLKQIFLNPIIIATFLGLFIWVFQASLPTVTIKQQVSNSKESIISLLNEKGSNITDFSELSNELSSAISSKITVEKKVPFARIDLTLPWVFQGLKYLGGLSSPLAWLAIGMTLANISLKEALEDRRTLIYGFIKLLIMPTIFMAILVILNNIFKIHFSYEAITAIIIMLATPPATVAVAYAIKFDKEQVLASNMSLVNSVLAVFAIAFWAFVCPILHMKGII